MSASVVDPLKAARRAEWKQSWTLVLAATIGLSLYSVVAYSIGLFIEPLSQEFDWSRTRVSFGMTLLAIAGIFLSPFAGGLIDRFGARRIALPGLVLSGLSLASFGLSSGSTIEWTLLWAFHALVLLMIKTTVWIAAVSSVFDASRSLAIAITICGTALAQAVVPPLSHWLIADFGWRMAFIYMGLGFGSVSFILSFFFLYDAHDFSKQKLASSAETEKVVNPETQTGLTLKQALRSPQLIRIALATFLTMLMGIAIAVNQVPILVDAGITREKAAYFASLFGIAGIAGKLITGWLMDHFEASVVGGWTIAVSGFAYLLLLKGVASPAVMIIGLVIIGYSAGTKLQLCAYLTSRHAGLLHYGKIFGVMNSLIALGGGFGPMAANMVYDSFNTYEPFIYASVVVYLAAAALMFTLGPTPKSFQAPEPATA